MAIRDIFYKEKHFRISYEIANKDKPVDLVVLHGWGSNKEIMKQSFGDKMKGFRHIYIDLPGFGKSSNDFILDSFDYAKIIDIFLKEIKVKKDIVMGHSFGGKIATVLNPNLLVLLSSAGIVLPKSLNIKIKIATFKVLKNIGFGGFYKFFATKDAKDMKKNMYETLKRVVDEDFSDIFRNFKNDTLIFWGRYDDATPLKTAEEINRLIKNSKLYMLEGDHFFFIKNSRFISEKILEFPFQNLS